MTEINFIFWLQGFLELADPGSISLEQIEIIKKHIALVLINKTKTTSDNEFFNLKTHLSC